MRWQRPRYAVAMRRLSVPAAILAVLALSGCASSATRTTSDGCESVTSSWDDFTAVAQRDGRADSDMLAARDEMLATWDAAIDDGPAWTQTVLGNARDTFADAVDGGDTTADAQTKYSTAVDYLDLFVQQCQDDGNLDEGYQLS